jgi:hypothetical protein
MASWLGAMGLFAGTAGAVPMVVLEPIPWATAGVGMHLPYLEADVEGSVYDFAGGFWFDFELPAASHIAYHEHGVPRRSPSKTRARTGTTRRRRESTGSRRASPGMPSRSEGL